MAITITVKPLILRKDECSTIKQQKVINAFMNLGERINT
jgi:hypothetical protein